MLTLIDGNSLLFRAYYGVHSRLTRSDGTPVGAVYGFFNMMLPILSSAQPGDAFVCVFDASRISFRQDIYPAYKANRPETPDDLVTQSHMVRAGAAAMGMPVLCIPGVEADDVIATLARQNCSTTDSTRIITGDKDLMQLVSDCVFLYDGMKQREIRAPGVLEKFGVTPDRVVDVQDFVRTKLESNSLVAKIEKLFPLEKFDASHAVPEFQFAASACPVEITTAPRPSAPTPTPMQPMTFEIIQDVAALKKFLSQVKNIIAIDTETTGLNPISDKMVGISLATDATHGAYIPLRHTAPTSDLFGTDAPVPNQLSVGDVWTHLGPILENPNIVKVGHNLKYDLHIMANDGWDIEKIAPVDDTMLLSYALDGTLHGHGLDELAMLHLGHENIHFSSLFPPKTRDADMHFAHLDISVAAPYAAEDATVCMALYEILRPRLDANAKLRELYETCDLPLMPILVQMERNGVLVNRAGLQQLSGAFHDSLGKLESEIWALAGHEFNIASPKQLGAVLFDELKLPANKKRSTDADTLGELGDAHPIVDKILSWRSIAKLAGTYADTLPRQIASDGRIHTTYLQTSTNTGRLSSRDPNLQNIPIKTELGEQIRKCFVAPTGRLLISVDYSQIQLRLLADVADVATFKETFHAGTDIHEQTARKIFGIAPGAPVPREMRRAAKTVNFSIIYGISSFGLAGQLGISRAAAAELINSYMAGLPEIEKYITETRDFAMQNACVYTPWGRRIELPEVRNPRLRAYAMRAAVNAPIQGFEADLMRRAMVQIYRDIVRPNADKIKLIMQVHDEMVFECDAAVATEFATQIQNAMTHVATLAVPLAAEYVIAPVWGK